MKTLLVILTLLSFQARAAYDSPQFKACYDLFSSVYSDSTSLSKCSAQSEVELTLYTDPNFSTCLTYMEVAYSKLNSISSCMAQARNSNIAVFGSSSFKACVEWHQKSYSYSTSLQTCLTKDYSATVQTKSVIETPLNQVNQNLRYAEGAQILLRAELKIPSNKGCGAAVETKGPVQCYVCQSQNSRNLMLYTTESILKIGEVKMLDSRKEIQITLSDSDDLGMIRCQSSENMNISSSEQLTQALNESGIQFKDADAVRKTIGKGAQP